MTSNKRGQDKTPRKRRTKAELGKPYNLTLAHQIYCRVSAEEKAAKIAEAKEKGLSLSDSIRIQLGLKTNLSDRERDK